MSGHSKWSTIKHDKGIADQKRGKAFSKIGRAIVIAVKEGKGGDPASNARLRLAMEQAKAVNMPKENIKRAIDRGLGKGSEASLEEVAYEGFGPEKIAFVIECVTDNKNRTGAEIRSVLERQGGGLGTPGSASWQFQKKGLILVEAEPDVQAQILKLIDCGVEEVEEDTNLIEVYTQPGELEEVKQKIISTGFKIKEASLGLKPTSLISISEEDKKRKILNLLEQLEDLEDVQKVYCNADFVE